MVNQFNMKLIIVIALLPFFGFELALATGKQCEVIHQVTRRSVQVDCNLDPESVVGPYYLPLNRNRRDITERQPGVPVELNLIVMNVKTCEPISNATVDIWHANSTGVYSGYKAQGTAGQIWLRGVQVTNSSGAVTFDTIYPGWYPGRAIHIHLEVFVGGNLKHVGQLYFNQSYTDAVKKVSPYSTSKKRLMRNEADSIYNKQGGSQTLFKTLEGDAINGYSGLMYIGVDPTKAVAGGSRPGAGRPQGGRPHRG